MTLEEAIMHRHSVRSYTAAPLQEEDRHKLEVLISQINEDSGLHIQLICGQTDAFKGLLAHYGGFRNVQNYIALIGPDTPDLEEKCGYYGEKIVLEAEMMGLGTCWVGGTYRKNKARYDLTEGEKCALIISVGYPAQEGRAHRSKKPEEVSNVTIESPAWFRKGVEYALLAPTAINQQKFYLELKDNNKVRITGKNGPFYQCDLGIVKYHFEIGAGEHFTWEV